LVGRQALTVLTAFSILSYVSAVYYILWGQTLSTGRRMTVMNKNKADTKVNILLSYSSVWLSLEIAFLKGLVRKKIFFSKHTFFLSVSTLQKEYIPRPLRKFLKNFLAISKQNIRYRLFEVVSLYYVHEQGESQISINLERCNGTYL